MEGEGKQNVESGSLPRALPWIECGADGHKEGLPKNQSWEKANHRKQCLAGVKGKLPGGKPCVFHERDEYVETLEISCGRADVYIVHHHG